MAVRYDQKKKDEVVEFIQKYNADNGRGGQSAAAEKYKISPITIANWLKKAGVKKSGKKAAAKSAGRKSGRGRKPAVASSSLSGVLSRMAEIQAEIEDLQAEFDQLKAQL